MKSKHASIETALSAFGNVSIGQEEYDTLAAQLPQFPYYISEEGVCRICRKGGRNPSSWVEPISSYIRIKKKLITLETGEIKVCLEYFNGFEITERIIERDTFSRLDAKKLLNYGITFIESSFNNFQGYLIMSDKKAPIEFVHTSLGWGENNGTPIFKSYKLLISKEVSFKSEYSGPFDVKPHGSEEKWFEMVKQDVLPSVPLTFCLLLGFAAPILSYLSERHDLGTLVFSLCNESSKGKTTSAMLAVSVFSNPVLGKGTMRSFFETQNFLLSVLSTGNSFPIAFDEAATYNSDFEKLFYLIAGGEDKGRLNSNSEMRPRRSWGTIVLMTSEFPTMGDSAPNGIKARCFNLFDPLTDSAEQSDRIKKTVTENYGFAGNSFISWLLENKMDSLESDYLKCKDILYLALRDSAVSDRPLAKRIMSKFAVILQTANYVSECFSLAINIDELIKYLLLLEKRNSDTADPAAMLVDMFLQDVSRNYSKYLSADNPNPSSVIGKIVEFSQYKTISILKSELEKYGVNYGIKNLHSVLGHLRENHILQCEQDRLTKRVRLRTNDTLKTCYVLKIPDAQAYIPYRTSERATLNKQLDDDHIEYSNLVSEDELNF